MSLYCKCKSHHHSLEYSLTGLYIKSPISANLIIDAILSLISFLFKPNSVALSSILFSPENSWLNPVPSSSRAPILPCTSMFHSFELQFRKSFVSVLFPEPFLPIIPRVSPFLRLRFTPFTVKFFPFVIQSSQKYFYESIYLFFILSVFFC